MRKVIYSLMVSLDGFIEGPNRELDWAIIDEGLHTYINDQQSAIDTYLYGRRTYELMVDYGQRRTQTRSPRSMRSSTPASGRTCLRSCSRRPWSRSHGTPGW